jgi:hypothetical protein
VSEALVPALIAGATLLGLVVIALAGLKAWHEWLALQRLTLDRPRGGGESGASGARIELADLKERVRKLEAIASGVDL